MFLRVCALAATAPLLSHASPSTPWLALDQELDALATAVRPADAGPTLSGWIQTRFAWSNDVDASGAPGNQDLSGFQLDAARLALSWMASPDVSGTLSIEAGDSAISDASAPGVGLLDAYASVKLAEHSGISIGRLSQTVLWSSGIRENRRVFLDRSFLGETLDGRDIGFEVSGSFDRWNAWAAVQNGSDLTGDGYGLSARVSYKVLGTELPSCEGCCAPVDGRRLTIGAAWFDDTGLDDGTAIAADAFFATERWSASAEWVDFGDDLRPVPLVNATTGAIVPSVAGPGGAQSAWNATVGCVLTPNAWEVAARWQDLDDQANTTIASAGVVHYAGGPDTRWIAQLEHADSDDGTLEHDAFALGLLVGF